jgi:hypothetical protein
MAHALPLHAQGTSAPPAAASATHTRVLFWGSTAAGEVRRAPPAARGAGFAGAGSGCQGCQLGAPLGAPTVAHPRTPTATASSV